jgi:hypothetical protein
MRAAPVIALIALAACSRPAAVNAPANATAPPVNAAAAATPAAPNPKLAQIFTPDILGANVAYLETITGPAFSTAGHDRTYKVGGCEVIVGVAGAKIADIGIVNYGPACSFPIAQYFAGGYDRPVPRTPSFGDIQSGLGGDYSADCLALCGNAADPVVTLTYHGSHADNFNDLVAQVSVNTDPIASAWQDWSDKVAPRVGETKLETGTDGISDTMQSVAAKDFQDIRPTTIRVGSDLPGSRE